MTLSGQTVLVVGAASGLGAACLQAFAGRGALCIAVDRNAAALAQLDGEVGGVETVAGDATDPAFAQSFAGRPIDILIHTAGIDPLSAVDVPGTSLEDWSAVLAVNLTSAFLFTRAVLPGMIERHKGCLLFTGSVSGLRPTPMEAAYSVSKAGVIQLARAIALDHARQGVRANVLCPGLLESVMADRKAAMAPDAISARHDLARTVVPLGREGRYAEMGRLALTLCDDEVSGYVTGQAIVADGGFLLL